MNFNSTQRQSAKEYVDSILKGTIRGYVLQGENRAIAVTAALDGIAEDYGRYAMQNIEHETSADRGAIVASVQQRMRENPKCGSIILTILISAVVSWLIHRLLDWIFSTKQYPEND